MAKRYWSVLLAVLACWCLTQPSCADRYTAGTLRQYLQEVVVEAMAAHCPTAQPPPVYATTPPPCYPAAAAPACVCVCERTPDCAEGYVRCGGVCYQRLSVAVSHANAEKACADRGGRLAVPRSDDEQLCARALALGSEVWLGITDPSGRGAFVGSDGAAVATDGPYWDNGQPDSYTGEDPGGERCVELFPKAGWHDRYCNHRARPLCQLE